MIKLAIYDYIRYLRRSVVTAAFMAVLCLVIVCLHSLFQYEYGKYKPYRDISEYVDYYISYRNGFFESDYDCVEQVYYMYQTRFKIGGESITAYVYDEWIYGNWTPRLREGEWLSKTEDGVMQIVLGGVVDEHHVGEEYIAEHYLGEVPVQVIGILQADTEIIWSTSESYDGTAADNYLWQYKVPEITGNSGMYALMTREDAERYGLSYSPSGSWVLLRFRDGMTEEEITEVSLDIYANNEKCGTSMEKFMATSREMMLDRIFRYLPLTFIGLVLTLMVIVSTSMIHVREAGPIYSIYYLTGASKRKCYIIALGNVFGTIAMSALFYIVLRAQLLLYAQKNNLTLSLVGTNRYAVILYTSFALFMMLNFYVCMHKQSALKMLKENRG